MNILKYIYTFILLIAVQQVSAQDDYSTKSQKAIKFYEAGKTEYRLGEFLGAEELMLKAIKIDSNFQEPYLVMAEMYWDQKLYEKAIAMYDKGMNINENLYPLGFSNMAKLQIKVGEYEGAKESFQRYLSLDTKNEKRIKEAERGIAVTEFAIAAVNNPVDFKPIRLSNNINSDDDEYWPTISADAQTLIFTRLVGSSGGFRIQEDFYVSSFDSITGWSRALDAGAPLNTPDNEGAQTISADGNFMVYTVCNRKGVIGRCDLYYSEKVGGVWSEPRNIDFPVNTKHKETQPSLSSDGRTLYFVSDRPGGKGKHDIWVSKQDVNGNWGIPENLGDSINTPGFESSPFIHHDNNTLYYSSNHHFGLGGFDIFYSRKNKEGKWTKATNIGYPINTYRDEIGLIINAKGNTAYYSSDIFGTSGKDIYQFELYEEARPAEVSYLKGKVYDSGNRKALKAGFELYDLADGSLVTQSYSDFRNGEFLVCLPTDRNYMLNVSKEGYLFYSENFSLEGVFHLEEPFYKDIPLKKIVAGRSIVLRNVFFETADFTLKPESKHELDKVVQFLNNNPTVRIEISGHTDNVGGEAYNQKLSEQRAQSVVNYIVSQGIDSNRMNSAGYGFSKSIESNETEEGRSKNRRTELKIIE